MNISESWKALAARTLWETELQSARANLLMSLSNLEQAAALSRTLPDCAEFGAAIQSALQEVQCALATLRFDLSVSSVSSVSSVVNPHSPSSPENQ